MVIMVGSREKKKTNKQTRKQKRNWLRVKGSGPGGSRFTFEGSEYQTRLAEFPQSFQTFSSLLLVLWSLVFVLNSAQLR